MCLRTSRVFLMEAPAHSIAKLRSRFPAGILFNIKGWLFQTLIPWHFLQLLSIEIIVPDCVVLISGFGCWQMWQNWNRSNNFERKTMHLGSSRQFFPSTSNLCVKKKRKHLLDCVYVLLRVILHFFISCVQVYYFTTNSISYTWG